MRIRPIEDLFKKTRASQKAPMEVDSHEHLFTSCYDSSKPNQLDHIDPLKILRVDYAHRPSPFQAPAAHRPMGHVRVVPSLAIPQVPDSVTIPTST